MSDAEEQVTGEEAKAGEAGGELRDSTRRSFLQAAIGTGLTVAALGGGGVELVQLTRRQREDGQARQRATKFADIELKINGETRRLNVPHQRTLLLALREDLGLTGTKKGCNLGQCGACTVLLDGQPVYACFLLALDAVGHDITTIEGLERDGALHPVQQGFIDKMGSQCGHCTPGMILSGVALLEENPAPSVTEIKRALSGNLCRCGNYENEIAAVMAGAQLQEKLRQQTPSQAGQLPTPPVGAQTASARPSVATSQAPASATTGVTQAEQGTTPSASQLNSTIPTLDARAKATGAARYAGDLGFHTDDEVRQPLFAKVLRSPYAHAEVRQIDDALARQLPGYRGMITFRDVPEFKLDRHPLNDKARHVGDALAAVVADDQYTAQEALDLLRVDFAPLPAYLDEEAALAARLQAIHPKTLAGFGGQPMSAETPTIEFKHGDIAAGFAAAEQIVEGRYVTPVQSSVPIEMHVCTAAWQGDQLTVWDSQQSPHRAAAVIAERLHIPAPNVRVTSPFLGGGFGSKCTEDPGKTLYQVIAALLAKKTGRPVRLEFTLKEEIYAEDVRNPFVMYLKTGVKRDGTITAIECRAIQRAGAYASTSAPVASVAGEGILGTYRCDNFHYYAYCVYTNTPVGGEVRGFGHPQAVFCLETHIDKVAESIGVNPLALRLKNYLRVGERVTTPGGKLTPIASSGLEECIRKGAEAIGWDKWEPPTKKSGRRRRGLGMRISQEHSGRDASIGLLWIDQDGRIHVPLGIGNIGTEAHTGIALIVAEALGVPVSQLVVTWGDSATTAWDFVTDASRSLHCCGKAFYNAAQDLLRQLASLDNSTGAATGADLRRFQNGIGGVDLKSLVARAKPRQEFAPFCNPQMDVSPKLNEQTGAMETPTPELDPQTAAMAKRLAAAGAIVGLGYYVYSPGVKSWGAGFVDCEVDMTTGEVEIIKMVCAHDVGRVIHRPAVEAQVHGGGIFGLGYGWTEELLLDPHTGIPVNASLYEYRPLTILDVPEIVPVIVEAPVEAGPFGAKGIGESPVFNGAPALANAIYNATGVRVEEIPLTPQRVYSALKRAGKLMP